MRPLEWVTAVAVVLIAWHWFRGRRAGKALAVVGAGAAAASAVFEGPRAAMAVAYVVAFLALAAAFLRGPAAPPASGWLRATGRGIVAVLAVILGAVFPGLWPVIKLPAPTGPHPIGTAWLVVRDSTRQERFGARPGTFREYPVKVWYPAAKDAVGPRAKYAETEEMTAAGMIPRVLAEQVRLVKTHAILGAAPAEGRAPVLIFSHGYTGYASQNTPQMEELASRGYFVASIVHTGEAAWAPFPNGRGVPMDSSVLQWSARAAAEAKRKGVDPRKYMDSVSAAMNVADPVARREAFRGFINASEEPLRSQSVAEWAKDTRALLDVLGNMNGGAAPSPFKGRLDLEHIGVFGMSYGGATAGEFCRLDHRCGAAINIDGGQYGGLVDDSLTVPFLIIGSEQAYGLHLPVLDFTRGPAFLVKVPATTHIGLTDLTLQGPIFKWIGVVGTLDPDRRESIMTDFVVGFFEKYLMRRNSDLWDELPKRYPEVPITARSRP